MAGENDNIRIKQIKVSNNESHEIAARSLLTAGGNERTFEDILRGGFYGICSTLPSVQNKVVVTNLSLHSAISLRAGSVIRVKFTYPNTYYDPENATESLRNINLVLKDADEETVLATNPVVAYLENGVSWRAGEIVEFVYDGADWNPVQIRDEGIEPYQPIEYAIFNGSHYVDSGLRFTNATNYSISFTIRETTPAYGLVGSYESDYDYVVKNSNATNLSWYYNTQTPVAYTQANWATNTLYTIKVNGNNLFLNNILVLTAVKKNFTDTLTAYFGNRNSANNQNGLDGRLYGFTIDHEGVHYNYVPCYRKSDNVLGFYDAGTKVFLPVHIYGSENLVTYTKNATGGDIVKNADLLVNQTDLQNALFTVSKNVDLQDVTNNGNITTNDIITKGDLIVQGSESDSTSSSQIQFKNTSTGAKTGYFTSNTSNQFIIGLGDTSYYNFNTSNLRPVTNKAGTLDLGATDSDWRNIYLNGSFYKRNGNNTYTLTVPNKTGTIALLSDIPGAAPNEYGKISDGNTTTTADAQQDTITFAKSGDLSVSVSGDTVTYGYSHPTTTAVTAGLYRVGRDSLGHVTFGDGFSLSDATITVKQEGVSPDQTFTLNGSAATINLKDTNTTYTLGSGSTANIVKLTPSTGSAQEVTVNNVAHATAADSATNANKLNNKEASFYLDYDNFTNIPTVDTAVSTSSTNAVQNKAIANYIASRGENLLTNGSALLGNNYNFTTLVFDGSDTYYADGCFKKDAWSAYGTFTNDEFIPVDINQTYLFDFYTKTNHTGAQVNGMITAFDIDKKQITSYQVAPRANTLTTLAQELKNGDTKIYLTDMSHWQNTSLTSNNSSVLIYGYKNSYGYEYPPETYTQYRYASLWSQASQMDYANNCITLNKAWDHGTFAAGTPISQGQDGSGALYCNMDDISITATLTAGDWEHHWYHINGVQAKNTFPTSKFPFGTAYIKVGLMNRIAYSSKETFKISTLSLSSQAATNHTHGNITSTGTLSTASRIVVTDSNKKITVGSINPADIITTGNIGSKDKYHTTGSWGSGANDWTYTATAQNSAGELKFTLPDTVSRVGHTHDYAPVSHASTANTYGLGTKTNYGHNKLLDGDLNGASYTDGVAAAAAHSHSQYALAVHTHDQYITAENDGYHTSGSWNGLTYTATAHGNAGALAFTIPTGSTATTVAAGNHTHTNMVTAANTLTADKIIVGTGNKTVGVSAYTISDIVDIAEGKTDTYVIATKACITGTEDASGQFTNVSAIKTAETGGTDLDLSKMKIGDNIYVKQTGVPDYWVSEISGTGSALRLSLNKLETTKVDIGTLNTTATTAQTTSADESLSGNITLHKIAKTGTYSDLIGKPSIPTVGNLITNATTSQTASAGQSMTGDITLHKIAKTGSYNDLLNKPSVIISDDTIMNTNPFGGKKLYLNSIDNAFASADKKYWVTVTKHKRSDNGITYPYADTTKAISDDNYYVDGPIVADLTSSAHNLFNGSYEDAISLENTGATYLKVRVMFGSNTSPSASTSSWSGYPYGYWYLSFYYNNTPNVVSQARVYNKYAAHTVGWHVYNATWYSGSASGQNVIHLITDTSDYQRTCVDFIIYGNDTSGRAVDLTQIDYKLQRPNLASNGSTVTKYGNQDLTWDFAWKDNHADTLKIAADGTLTATKVKLYGSAVSPASGQYLAVYDANGLQRTTATFDGSTTDQYLSKKGTFESLPTVTHEAEFGKISDGTTTTTASTIQDTITFAKGGDLSVDVTGKTVTYSYSHPTTTAVSASYYEVGKDALGHVVLGNAFVLPTKASWDYDDRYVRFDTNAQGLTDTQKANARTNIGAGTGNGTVTSVDSINPTAGNVALSAVRYVSQTLTDAQKIQARINIGAGTGTVKKVNNVTPDNNGNVSLTIPATNVIPAVSTANKVLLSTATNGTAKWSDFTTAGFLKTNSSGVISIDSTTYQSKLTTQTAYTAVGSSTKVPVITTNTLGQVTAISTADIVSANDATLTVQRNSSTVGTFTANASVNKTIDIKDIYTVSLSDIDSTHSTAETYVFTAAFSAIVESMQYTLAIDLALFNPDASGMVYVKPEFGGVTLDSSIIYTYACVPTIIEPRTPIPMIFYKAQESDTQLSLGVAQAGAAVSGAASLESISYSNNEVSAYNGNYASTIFIAKTLNDNSILDSSNSGTLEDCLIARPVTMPTATATSADFVANDGKLYTKKIEESGGTTTYSYEEVGASVELPQILRYI